jgi:hypothetical protein
VAGVVPGCPGAVAAGLGAPFPPRVLLDEEQHAAGGVAGPEPLAVGPAEQADAGAGELGQHHGAGVGAGRLDGDRGLPGGRPAKLRRGGRLAAQPVEGGDGGVGWPLAGDNGGDQLAERVAQPTDRNKLLDQLDDNQVVFADLVGGGRRGEAEGVMQPLHRRHLDAALGAELLVGARQPRWAPIVGASMKENGNSPRAISSPIASTFSPAASQALRNRSQAASWIANPPAVSRFCSAPAWMTRSTKAGSTSASRARSSADSWV